ncbi:MAG TPA: ATP-binding protein, partial [Solirubrobacteraceae bacterium]
RMRAQERAEMADHLHDSVLQTLALIQRNAGDPAEVSGLARRQERDLRDWLLDRPGDPPERSLAGALRAAVAAVEDSYRVAIEIVTVGDASVDEATEAMLAAANEAMVNAAKHARGAAISVFARVDGQRISVYVHDRGPGFIIDEVPAERRGVRESIIGRMRRHGGYAEVHSEPGAGCEVLLFLERR